MGEDDVDIMTPDRTFRTTPCSQCNFPIQPDSSNTCIQCLRSKNDITLGLPKKLHLLHCPQCKTYSEPLKSWIKLQLQPKQLLDFCLILLEKNLSFNNLRLVRSQTILYEPISKIIKIRATVQKEVLNAETLQQSYLVEFVQHNCICESCTRVQPDHDEWNSVVQLRQHGCLKRSFFRLDHGISKHRVAAYAVRINKMKHGIDYFFSHRIHVNKLLDFIKGRVPVRVSESKELVSHDTDDYRYTFSVEVCPICRHDLIFLPPKVASSVGNIGPIVVCTKVSNVITLLDPFTSTQCCLDGDMYWRAPFKSLLTKEEFVEYIVLDVKEVLSKVNVDGKKFNLANVEIARVNELGKNDTRFSIKTHLGYLLKTGDYALGYDLWEANCSDSEIELKEHIEDGVMLIKKRYGVTCLMKRRAEHLLHLKDLEEITNEVLGISLGAEEPPLEKRMGDLNLSGDEHKEKKARRMA
ncbi:uncharacterized protein LOC127117733 [Lathyrus oleraceus]|uniref:60S ribosomal export protein NMD3 n=1 Tax=Pisum sativum TaxID=3888 RepID=A0A9D5B7U5_PEA|nr:uncharacterized protein LOC127115123 [Pisum sativum]XP_050902708.1 uncharacterized protein LOC127115123 [Pisum sativum]XP_050902709.1 uncharacterized protein LOC127115123 [Pisum sativum]XP_050903793.1 uncharacterized protein LOC127117733 [Pisum sativum]XP_050903794.1 uncharacterized protein LOC127117733 [Pisum sativum]XP_050903795.1 uncharacterized protein LOC127117733 [Pisum sativum]XP_050903796.1 uncharacterized protein LOC127117733 [Pisum sativum]KAI5381247.1 hypothetical protein KIW84